jgi:hypothetical protein
MTVAATLPRTSRHVRTDLAVLGVGALLVRLPAFFAARHLHPDDGFYGMAVVAMRDGGVPYREVFSSQGPLHLPLLYAGDLLGLRTTNAPRVTPVLAGIAVTLLAYLVGRRISTRFGAWLAAVGVGLSGSVLWVTSGITSDGPTLAFVVAAFLAALRYRDAPSPARAAVVALLLTGGILVKPAMGVLGGLAAVYLVLRERRVRDVAWASGAAVVAALVVTVPFGLATVWRQTVDYQLSSVREQGVLANAGKVVSTLWDRDSLLLGLALLAVAALAFRAPPEGRAERRATSRTDRVVLHALWLWFGVVLAFLVLEPALWRNHLSALVPPMAFLVASRPPPVRWVAIAAVVVVPLHVSHLGSFFWPEPYRGPTREAHDALTSLPDGAWAISDDIGILWRAGVRTTDDFVDTSIKRQQQRQITVDRIVQEASDPRVCAVLVWSARHWGSFDDLPRALAEVGYEPVQRFSGQDGVRVLYETSACRARS